MGVGDQMGSVIGGMSPMSMSSLPNPSANWGSLPQVARQASSYQVSPWTPYGMQNPYADQVRTGGMAASLADKWNMMMMRNPQLWPMNNISPQEWQARTPWGGQGAQLRRLG